MAEINNEAENAENKQWTRIHPALDFTVDHAYIGQEMRSKRENSYFIVTDEGFVIPTQPEDTLEHHHLELTHKPLPISEIRWTGESINKFSKLKRYPTEEPIAVERNQLIANVRTQFTKYIEFADERCHSFFALWAIGTYCFPLFNTYPYVHLLGLPQSGKSKLLSLCSCLSFNGLHTPNISTACIFRLIETQRDSLFIDEAETLSNQNEDTVIRSLLLCGYKKGGSVLRAERDGDGNFIPTCFSVYGPKMIANIEGLEEVLSLRCITVIMQRGSNHEITNREINIEDILWKQIRDAIYPFIMINWKEIRQCYIDFQDDVGLNGRELELWKPILALAKFFSDDFFTEMKALALEKTTERNRISVTDEQILMETLLSLVTEDGFYKLREITNAMASRLDSSGWLSPGRVARLLRTLGFNETRRLALGTEYMLKVSRVNANAKMLGVSVDSADSEDTRKEGTLEERVIVWEEEKLE